MRKVISVPAHSSKSTLPLMTRLLFVCKKNSRRSQMAEAFARHLGASHLEVFSAGLESSTIPDLVVTVMDEVGISIATQVSQALSEFEPEDFDIVISLCGCGASLPTPWLECPRFEDWNLEDPAGDDIEPYRRVRDQIEQRVRELLASLLLGS